MVTAKWNWIGNLSATGATVAIKTDGASSDVRVRYSLSPDLSNSILTEPGSVSESTGLVCKVDLIGLQQDTQYFYNCQVDGNLFEVDGESIGSFRTIKVNEPYNFAVAFGSCVDSFKHSTDGSNNPVFETIRNQENPAPVLFIHMGDLHYEDPLLNEDDPILDDDGPFRDAYDKQLLQPKQMNLFRNMPIAYIWDDHDYGQNDGDASYIGRPNACRVYREQVPHYPLVKSDITGPIYHSFVVGRVRFIMTDVRSERVPKNAPDNPSKTIFSTEQDSWFKNELITGRDNQELIVWVNAYPWIGGANSKGAPDHWGGYTNARQEIANFLKDNNISARLIMISGDMHALAMDDGTNSDYAVGGGAGFPVIHAASIADRGGTTKGGPYSFGAPLEGDQQFGVLEFVDDGDSVQVNVTLKKNNTPRLSATFFPLSSPEDPVPGFGAVNNYLSSGSEGTGVTSHPYVLGNGIFSLLKDRVTNTSINVETRATTNSPTTTTNNGSYNAGTEAYDLFNGVTTMTGGLELSNVDAFADIELQGLKPDGTYTISLSANRNEPNYDGQRFTKVRLVGASGHSNISTNGVNEISSNEVSFCTGYNTERGYVARWQFTPSTSGTVKIESRYDDDQPGAKSYAMNHMSLKEEETPTPPIVFEAINTYVSVGGEGIGVTNHPYVLGSGILRPLKDRPSNVTIPISTLATTNSVTNTTNGGPYNVGTEAFGEFDGFVSFMGGLELRTVESFADIELHGLDPSATYIIVVSANRNNPSYDGERFTRVKLVGTASNTNLSTQGVIQISNNEVSYCTGYNGTRGYVAKWRFSPPADGKVKIESRWDHTRPGAKGYAMTHLKLRKVVT